MAESASDGERTFRLSRQERAALAAAYPVLQKIFEALKVPAAPSRASRHAATLLSVLTYVATGIIGSATVLAGSVVASLASILPSEDAGPYERLYLDAFGCVLAAVTWLLFAATLAAVLLQLLRTANKLGESAVWAWCTGSAGALIVLLLVLWPGFRTTETAVCAATAITLDLPNQVPFDRLGPGIPFDCAEELARWELVPPAGKAH